jgi:hypothetical protein
MNTTIELQKIFLHLTALFESLYRSFYGAVVNSFIKKSQLVRRLFGG